MPPLTTAYSDVLASATVSPTTNVDGTIELPGTHTARAGCGGITWPEGATFVITGRRS